MHETIQHLMTLKEKYPSAGKKLMLTNYNRLKAHTSFEISNFCYEISPTTCKKCSSDFIPCEQNDTAVDNVNCMICDKTAHQSCYNNETMDPENGIIYLCSECLKAVKASRMDTIKLVNTVQIQTEAPSKSNLGENENNSSSAEFKEHITDDSDVEDDQSEGGYRRVEKKKRNSICKLYKVGTCPYGRYGRGCSKQHPQLCRRWCSFGDSKWGCKDGDECYYFHPEICEDSEKTSKCLNIKCKKVHMKGTQRYRDGWREGEEWNHYRGSRNYNYQDKTQENYYSGQPRDRRNTDAREEYSDQFRNRRYTDAREQRSDQYTSRRNTNAREQHSDQFQNQRNADTRRQYSDQFQNRRNTDAREHSDQFRSRRNTNAREQHSDQVQNQRNADTRRQYSDQFQNRRTTDTREQHPDQFRSRRNTDAREQQPDQFQNMRNCNYDTRETYTEDSRNRRNTNTRTNPTEREENNPRPQEATMSFLSKYLEGVQEKLTRQLNENMTHLYQKMLLNQQNQVRTPVYMYNPYQMNQQTQQIPPTQDLQAQQMPQNVTAPHHTG